MRYNFALRIIIPALPEAESQAAEHFEERRGGCLGGVRRDRPEFPHQALPEPYRYSCGVGPCDRCHGSNDDGLQMLIHFVG